MFNESNAANRKVKMKNTQLQVTKKPKALDVMAARMHVEPSKLYPMLKDTVFQNATDNEMMALVIVANEYRLNPLTREIYAFPKKGGGIVPVVSIDGWVHIVNDKDDFDGCQFEWEWKDESKKVPESCTCVMHHKRRSHPVIITEYFDECVRTSEPWKNMPRRMLRHKAYIQAGRLAFGLSGIYDEDEARDIISGASVDVQSYIPEPQMIPGVTGEEPQAKQESPPSKDAPQDDAQEPKPTAKPKRSIPVRRKTAATKEDDTTPTNPMHELQRLMADDNVGGDQVLVFCHEMEWQSASEIDELSQVTMLKLISQWPKIKAELASIQI